MSKIYKLLICCLLSFSVAAQTVSVSGQVTANDGESLPGVSVMVKGTTRGTVTDINGKYQLTNLQPKATLVFSFTGFQKVEQTLNGQSTLDVQLKESTNELDEVVVTSFNIAKDKRELGYGSQTIKGDILKNTGDPNMVAAMQGKLAGVTINGSGGAPGAGTNIIIRGINSLSGGNDNQPLFIVDGIIISNNTFAGNALPSAGSNAVNSNEQFSNTNRAADMNPDDIESINVLKGAAATALYGQRASNGAIIITTKKGSAGKASITYSATYGVDNVDKVPAQQERYSHGLSAVPRVGFVFQQFGPLTQPGDPIFENFRTFFRQGERMSHNLGISGGNEKSKYYTSISYFDQKGIVPNTDFSRITAKLSGSTKVNNSIEVGGQLNYANSAGTSPAQGDKSIYSSLTYWSPSFDVNDYLKPDGTQNNVTTGIIDNPRYYAEKSALQTDVNRLFGDIYANLKLTDWLSARYQLTTDFYNDRRNRIVPPELDLGTQVRGFVIDESFNFKEFNSNFFLTATKNLSENLRGSLMVGHNATSISTDNLVGRGETFIAPGFFDISNTTNFTARRSRSLRRLVGVFSEAKLDYKNMLYLSITGRNDWSSTLPADNRSFFYPSVSMSYILTESFLKDNSVVSYAKLRGSLAQVGKDTRPYQIGSYYQVTPGFPFGSVGGFRRDPNIGNFNLLPEITTESEIGIETSLFNNKISLEANYFMRDSKNQIVDVPVSNVVGYARYTTNAGLIRNQGVEVLLGFKPIKTKTFSWETNFNWDRIRSRVLSMPEDLQEITYYDQGRVALRIVEGGSMGDLYGFDWNRNENGEVLINAQGLPTLNQASYVKVGNALPDWKGGMFNNFTYKNIALSFLLEWRFGGDVVDLGEMNSIRNGITKFTEERDLAVIFKGVKADGTPNDIPNYMDETNYRAFGFNAHYSYNIQDASWFRVRNANLSYNVPTKFLPKNMSSVRLSVIGNNLFLSTPFRGYDPESLAFGAGSNLIGFTGRNTPAVRSFIFGINVGL